MCAVACLLRWFSTCSIPRFVRKAVDACNWEKRQRILLSCILKPPWQQSAPINIHPHILHTQRLNIERKLFVILNKVMNFSPNWDRHPSYFFGDPRDYDLMHIEQSRTKIGRHWRVQDFSVASPFYAAKIVLWNSYRHIHYVENTITITSCMAFMFVVRQRQVSLFSRVIVHGSRT